MEKAVITAIESNLGDVYGGMSPAGRLSPLSSPASRTPPRAPLLVRQVSGLRTLLAGEAPSGVSPRGGSPGWVSPPAGLVEEASKVPALCREGYWFAMSHPNLPCGHLYPKFRLCFVKLKLLRTISHLCT